MAGVHADKTGKRQRATGELSPLGQIFTKEGENRPQRSISWKIRHATLFICIPILAASEVKVPNTTRPATADVAPMRMSTTSAFKSTRSSDGL